MVLTTKPERINLGRAVGREPLGGGLVGEPDEDNSVYSTLVIRARV